MSKTYRNQSQSTSFKCTWTNSISASINWIRWTWMAVMARKTIGSACHQCHSIWTANIKNGDLCYAIIRMMCYVIHWPCIKVKRERERCKKEDENFNFSIIFFIAELDCISLFWTIDKYNFDRFILYSIRLVYTNSPKNKIKWKMYPTYSVAY